MSPLEAGDIAWVEFDPVKGTEQAGRRPALVVSASAYNQASTRILVCPVTSRQRDWPFNIPLPPDMKTRGDILVDQLRAIDTSQRVFGMIERVPQEVLFNVRLKLAALLLGDDLQRPEQSSSGR